METKLTKLKAFKEISLTDEDRNLLRAHAARIVIASPVLVTESFFKRGVQHGLRIALSSMLFVLFIGGSVSIAANNALPGDPLYPIKYSINEEVKGLFFNTPAAKAVFEQNRVETRINEIQTLAASNSLTQAKQEIAAKALNSNIADLSSTLTTLSAQAPNTALTVTASLAQTLKANKTAIENTQPTTATQDAGKTDALNTVNATLQKVSNQEVQIISKEIDNINTAVTNVPDSGTSTTATASTTTTSPTTSSAATDSTKTPPPVTPATP